MLQKVLNAPVTEREKLIKFVRRWADVNTDGLLEESSQMFSVPGIEGYIGYRIESSNAVVYGDPVCSFENKPILAKAFQEYCNSQKLGVLYTIVSEDFAEWASNNLEAVTIEFGKKLVLDPHSLPIHNKDPKLALVRKKVRHALKEGITVQEYIGESNKDSRDIEQQIENVSTKWLQNRRGPQIYLSHLSLFKNRLGKRWFYAKQGESIVGLLILNRLESKNGWLLNNVMTLKDVSSGLSELLIISALETVEKEGCQYVLVGPIPDLQLGKITGISRFWAKMTRGVFQCAKYFFHLDGHYTYWDKFDPHFESSYLIFPKKNLGYSSIKALMQAYNVTIG